MPTGRYRTVIAETGEAWFAVLDSYSVCELVDRNVEHHAFLLADRP